MFDETGCDGLAIARGSFGNPWIFEEISEFLKNGRIIRRPAADEVAETIVAHLNLCVNFYGPARAVTIFRKFFNWYVKGFSHVRPLREKVCRAKTKEEFMLVVEEFLNLHK